jgi:hypothetical protein
MNKEQEIELLRDLQSLAGNCSQYAEGLITSEKMAFYCKNIEDALSKLLQEVSILDNPKEEEQKQP